MMILFNCKKASHICDKAQYSEAGRWEKWMMKVHHAMCKVCRDHAVKNTKLTRLLRRANVHWLPQQKKQELKLRLQRELARQP